MTNYRNEARDYFKASKLTYNDITTELLYMLVDMLNESIRKDKSDYWTYAYIDGRPSFNKDGLAFAEILGKGTYFDSRECITFNLDGFIGFCGDADQNNTKPITDAFTSWCDVVSDKKKKVL